MNDDDIVHFSKYVKERNKGKDPAFASDPFLYDWVAYNALRCAMTILANKHDGNEYAAKQNLLTLLTRLSIPPVSKDEIDFHFAVKSGGEADD